MPIINLLKIHFILHTSSCFFYILTTVTIHHPSTWSQNVLILLVLLLMTETADTHQPLQPSLQTLGMFYTLIIF